ncbi:hypothetical protein DDZ13_06630 [Coraliomargarita sinensis]|uniref:Uncharacterized protein n=1 Tax=Coraliomargarita sinensis TaxID=2174842 RepID=A0A317ZFP4_9BACT|nr:hypothetical protein [Coraliomargarita sinensis]PXA04210.1 hypothetical protein DDZ13_06630 [Coraliomargarita sinensis]
MAEETASPSSGASKDALDLNSLSGLDFGPDWADGKASKSAKSRTPGGEGPHKGKGKRSSPHASRDRRAGGRPQRGRADQGQTRGGQGKRGFGRGNSRPDFEPVVKVDLYPQDEAFDALVKRLRASARTYQLFEIAHLLLEKPERYVVVVTPKPKRNSGEDAKPLLYYSVPGHLPFESEEEAINYVLKEHIDQFFEIEEIEVDPPSGNFQMVNRCGITGELLGPPNYHRYQEFTQRHYAARISGMSFERFQSKIEASKEQEDIDAWLESMKKGARYTVKERQENEPESFDTLEAARHFLIHHRKDKVVGSGESVRFAGRDIERMPRSNIRRSVETYIEQQKHFPLDSANNIRGRLRRHKFAVYKKGSKGVSYVCAVKRKFRDSKTVFTDSIGELIDFIEKHPEIPASKLSNEYIGIDTEKQKPETLKMQEADQKAAKETANEDAAESATEPDQTPESDAPEAKEASTRATPKESLSADEQEKLNQLMVDLRWLITEGYVTEYGDGRLFAPPPLPEPKKKTDGEKAKVSEKSSEDQSEEPTVAETSEAEKKSSDIDTSASTDAPASNEPDKKEDKQERGGSDSVS